MRVNSDVTKAQAALRRYVGYRELLRDVKKTNHQIGRSRAMLDAYGAIDRTPFAGTAVFEIDIDDAKPVRRRRPTTK